MADEELRDMAIGITLGVGASLASAVGLSLIKYAYMLQDQEDYDEAVEEADDLDKEEAAAAALAVVADKAREAALKAGSGGGVDDERAKRTIMIIGHPAGSLETPKTAKGTDDGADDDDLKAAQAISAAEAAVAAETAAATADVRDTVYAAESGTGVRGAGDASVLAAVTTGVGADADTDDDEGDMETKGTAPPPDVELVDAEVEALALAEARVGTRTDARVGEGDDGAEAKSAAADTPGAEAGESSPDVEVADGSSPTNEVGSEEEAPDGTVVRPGTIAIAIGDAVPPATPTTSGSTTPVIRHAVGVNKDPREEDMAAIAVGAAASARVLTRSPSPSPDPSPAASQANGATPRRDALEAMRPRRPRQLACNCGPVRCSNQFCVRSAMLIGNLLLTFVSSGCDMIALLFAPVEILGPLAGSTLILNIFVAPFVVREKVYNIDLFATLLSVPGMIITSIFGPRSTPQVTTDLVVDFFERGGTMVYEAMTAVGIAACVFLIRTMMSQDGRMYARVPVLLKVRPFLYPFLAAALGGQQLLITKLGIELVDTSVAGGLNQFLSPVTFVVVVAAVVLSLTQLWAINQALANADALLAVPVYQSLYIVTTTVTSAIYFHQFATMEWWETAVFSLGVLMVVSGVLLLTRRPVNTLTAPSRPDSAAARTKKHKKKKSSPWLLIVLSAAVVVTVIVVILTAVVVAA